MTFKAMITGFEGTMLTEAEQELFRRIRPWGFILFARNVESLEQLRALTTQIREVTGREETLIFIDQEGGRVQRLRPPLVPNYPSASQIGALYEQDEEKGMRAAWLLGRLHAFDLMSVGINANCLPVLDVPVEGSHEVIGSRAYSHDPETVAVLGNAVAEGLMAGGVLPVMKHMPGHGRAFADSHKELPSVDAPLSELCARDFVPFCQLDDLPAAMTAHIVYKALDPERPATLSPVVINCVIRDMLDYDGLLMSDDISMKALSGNLDDIARDIIAAGCDVVLHCSGVLEETVAVAAAIPELKDESLRRAELAEVFAGEADLSNEAAIRAEFDAFFPVEVATA